MGGRRASRMFDYPPHHEKIPNVEFRGGDRKRKKDKKKDETKKKTQRDELQTHDVYRSQSFHFTYYSDYLLAWHLARLGICLTTSADGSWQDETHSE